MLRMMTCGLATVLFLAGGVRADPIVVKVKKVEGAKIVVTVDDKETTYDVAKDVKVTRTMKVKKSTTTEDVTEGLAGVKEGVEVNLTIEKKDGKDTVTKIDLTSAKKKKKKKNV